MITPADLMKAMQNFKESKNFGIDGISGFFLKIGISVFAQLFITISNKSISEGLFVSKRKVARVAPIHIEGPTEDRSNYRPMSVLPFVFTSF